MVEKCSGDTPILPASTVFRDIATSIIMQSNLNQLAVGRESPGARELDQVQQSPRVSRSVSEGVRRLRSDGMCTMSRDRRSFVFVFLLPTSASLRQRRKSSRCNGYNILIRSSYRILDRGLFSTLLVLAILHRRCQPSRSRSTSEPTRSKETAPCSKRTLTSRLGSALIKHCW